MTTACQEFFEEKSFDKLGWKVKVILKKYKKTGSVVTDCETGEDQK